MKSDLRFIIEKMLSSLPFLIFLVMAIFSSFFRSKSGTSKELMNRTAKVEKDYLYGPAEDKTIAKSQGAAARANTVAGSSTPRPSQVKVTGGTKKNASQTSNQGFAPKKTRGGVVESMTDSRGYVNANELDWSFEADNKPRKIPAGFDR